MEQTTLQAVDLLEGRLKRIEFALFGHTENESHLDNIASINHRLSVVEQAFQKLTQDFNAFQELLSFHSTHPHLFESSSVDSLPTYVEKSTIISILNASASLFSETASRLTSLVNLAIPPAELSAQLIEVRPQISKIEVIQANQQVEVAQLRERSAELIEIWYMRNILEAGEIWASLDTILRKIEHKVRQASRVKQADSLSRSID